NIGQKIKLIYHHCVRISEYYGVFDGFIIALRQTGYHNPSVFSQNKLSGAEKIAHILNEKQIYITQWQALEGMADHIGN
ncbi:unnamed protein product, partial [marine sediment metagenome]